MTFEEAMGFLNAAQWSQTRPGLGPVTELLHRIGDPQVGLRCVHAAGTNGKGSVCAYIESVLRAAGHKTGIYTSPYLEHFTERIRVDGEDIPEGDLTRITERVKAAVDAMEAEGLAVPTVFERITAVAFEYFAEKNCDIVVLEVGMGGRLDATNVIERPEVSVITKISYDHTEFLGDTLAEIAGEKAGIIKPGCPVVSYVQADEAAEVIKREASSVGAPLTFSPEDEAVLISSGITGQKFSLRGKEYEIGMLGRYQISNAVLALTALEQMKKNGWEIPDEAVFRGMKDAVWKGRFEVLSQEPVVIIDGAHNPDGVGSLAEGLKELFPGKKITFVAGVLADKDYGSMIDTMMPLAEKFITVTPESPRALPAEDLAVMIRDRGAEAVSCPSVKKAADDVRKFCTDFRKTGKKCPAPVICAFGSLYYIGEFRSEFTAGTE
jgi:dihydrofolate synthase/folylpolyglutamate synthase